MFSLWYMKLIFVLLITFLTLTAARRHGQHLQFDDFPLTGEYDIDQRPGNGHKTKRNYRGRGDYHMSHDEHRVNGGISVGLHDGYPIRGPVQQPFIPTTSNGRGQAAHRFTEPHQNFQQPATNNFHYPVNSFEQSSIKFPQHPSQRFEVAQNNFQDVSSNYQKPPVPPNNIQHQSANNYNQGPQTNPSHNGQQQSVNPFLPQRGFNQQHQTQTSTQTEAALIPITFPNKQNPHAIEPVTNELPTTVQASDATTSATNPRRTDLLFGSNLLEEDRQLNVKPTATIPFSIDDRGLFDTAPHCQSGYVLVGNKCRLEV